MAYTWCLSVKQSQKRWCLWLLVLRASTFCPPFAFAQVVDRLSSDDNGELLLQPIGHCKELIDGLASMAVDQSLSLERRTDSARTLLGITQKAADPNIVYVNARTVRPLPLRRPVVVELLERLRPGTCYLNYSTCLIVLCRCSCPSFAQSMYDSQPATTVVPNRLSSVRELLHEQLRAWLPKFCVAVSNCDDPGSGNPRHFVEPLLRLSLYLSIIFSFFSG